jgi:homoserine kinase type II
MAVFTSLSRTQIESVIAEYDCGDLIDFSGITEGSENTNYLCETSNGKFVLTIFEERSNPKHIQPQIIFIQNLYEAEFPVPNVLTHARGNYLSDVSGKKAMLQTFLDGKSSDTPTYNQCFSAGESLASMHLFGTNLKIDISNTLDASVLLDMAKQIQAENNSEELTGCISFLQNYQQNINLPNGAVHTDYFKDNVFFKDEKVSGIFDFWFSCDELLIYDLAIALNVWGFNNGNYQQKNYEAFLDGYISVRPLTTEEEQSLPQELQRAALRFYLTRLYDQVMTTKDLENKPPETWFRRFLFHKNKG